mgnify:CR=1 FL=1
MSINTDLLEKLLAGLTRPIGWVSNAASLHRSPEPSQNRRQTNLEQTVKKRRGTRIEATAGTPESPDVWWEME